MAEELKEKKKYVPADLSKFSGIDGEKVETGIIGLDAVLGGGFEKGDMIECSSMSGVGKSTVVLNVCKFLVQRGIKCAYLDFEHAVKKSLLEGMGLYESLGSKPGDKFLFLTPTTYADADKCLKEIYAPENGYGLVVIDSATSILPSKLKDKGTEDIEIGLEARLNSSFLKKYKAACRETGVAMWLVNQMRTDINTAPGAKTTEDSAGGMALKFYPDVRLRLQAGEQLKRLEPTLMGDREVVYGNMAHLWAVKNKATRPGIRISLPIIFGKGVSNVMTIKDILTTRKVILGGGGGYFTVMWKGETIAVRGNDDLNKWVKERSAELKAFLKESGMLNLTDFAE